MKSKFKTREDEILGSLDGIQPVDAPPFFYTRLHARMQDELVEKKETIFLLRPAFLTAALSVILLINIVFLFQFKVQKATDPKNEAGIESFVNAYGLDQKTLYE